MCVYLFNKFFNTKHQLVLPFLLLVIFVYTVTYIHDSKPMFYIAHFKYSGRLYKYMYSYPCQHDITPSLYNVIPTLIFILGKIYVYILMQSRY